ncbi:MAG TPA: FixH family protein, partial [Longimicrobium sp.]|nr:FixH family protein [Longimicrobium sp.]
PAALLLAACAASPAGGGDRPDAESGVYLSLDARPSHDGLYRAAVVRRDGAQRPGTAQSWTVRITDAGGGAVSGARVEASAWMPSMDTRAANALPPATELGNGRYRIDGVRFPAAGWWNVPVRITAGGRTDSLAFNLILPGAPLSRGGAR